MKRALLQLLLAAALWGGAVALAPAARGARTSGEELLYYPSGKFAREASLGFEQAAASLAWLRVVQYYGEHVKTDRQFEMMFHLCDVVTDLDPLFEEPYIFGSFVLLTEGRDPAAGMKLLEKGRLANPASWRLQFETGFVEYLAYRDYPEAARFFRRASVLPGSPDYVRGFAAYLSEQAGSLEAALELWTEYRETTTNPARRAAAEAKVRELRERLALRGRGDAQ